MDNKNEKTFADLFSSSSMNDDAKEKDGVTFDSFMNNFDDESDNNSISFGDIIGESDDVFKEHHQSFDENPTSLGLEEDKVDSNLFFNNQSENVTDDVLYVDNYQENNIFDNALEDIKDVVEEEIVQDNISEENILEEKNDLFFQNDVQVEVNNINDNDKTEDNVENINDNEDKEEEQVIEKTVDGDVSDVVKSDEKENVNLFFDNVQDFEEVKKINDEMPSEVVQEIDIDTNLFFDDDNEQVYPYVDTNSLVVGESINEMVEKSKEEKNLEVKDADNVSVSPFFQSSQLEDVKLSDSIFGDNGISFDQTKQVNSKVNKLDLSSSKHFNVKLVKQKPSLIRFLVGVVSYAFFIFLVLILVTLLAYVLDIKIRAAKGDYSAPTFNAYVVLTGSMLPEIQVKDVVVTKKVDANDLVVGDIITFASSDTRFLGTIITHRIIKKNQDKDGNITFQTRGDNNNVADSALVQPNNIYGKVILKIPKLGYLQDFLATQGGWIIVILLPCLAVISYDIVKLGKGIKRRRKLKVIK